MKGVAFTLDALFALIMTSIAVAVLLYFNYVPQAPYLSSFTGAQSLLDTMLASNVSSISGGDPVAAAMVNQQLASGEDAPEFINYIGGNMRGPSGPWISTLFNANSAITTPVVAGYGNIYFGAGNVLYAINASGHPAWSYNAKSALVVAPILYNGWVVIANNTNMTALNAYNGSIAWSNDQVEEACGCAPISTPLLEYNNRLIVGTYADYIGSDYAANGTIAWSLSTPSYLPASIAIADGSIAVMSSAGKLELFDNSGIAQTSGVIWSSNLAPYGSVTHIISTGNIIAYGAGSDINETGINGNIFYSTTGYGQVEGVGYYGPYIAYQTADAVVMIKSAKSVSWSTTFSQLSQTAMNVTPAVSGSAVYTLWNGGYLLAQNLSTGAVLWQTRIPYSNVGKNLTLAYGRLYVTAGNTVIGYGACSADPDYPILSAAETLYVNGDGSCADQLLDSTLPMYNYSIFGTTANTFYFMPANDIASFNGRNSMIQTGGGYGAPVSFTLSFWMLPYVSANQVPVGSNTAGLWQVALTPGNYFVVNPGTASGAEISYQGAPYPVKYGQWQMVTLTAVDNNANTQYKFYVNGTLINSSTISGSIISSINGLVFGGLSQPYNGLLANVQVYSGVLSPQQVAQLYEDGIQGSPLANSGAVSWYPLDGDANDYINASDSGYPYNMAYKGNSYLPKELLNAYEIDKTTAVLPARNYSNGNGYGLYNVGVYAWR